MLGHALLSDRHVGQTGLTLPVDHFRPILLCLSSRDYQISSALPDLPVMLCTEYYGEATEAIEVHHADEHVRDLRDTDEVRTRRGGLRSARREAMGALHEVPPHDDA